MPVTRRDDTKDPLYPIVLLIWQKKWLVVAVSVITAILVYIALIFVPSTFRANSEIFVNQLAGVTDGETPNPETVVSLLESQSVIKMVRNDYVKEFNIDPIPALEGFAKRFEVETHVLQDTTVKKEFSPVLTLQVEARGSSETRFIMERWVRNFITEFGNYTAQEAVMKREAYLLEKHSLETEITRVERLQAEAEASLPFLRKVLAEKLDLLTPSRLALREHDRTAEDNSGVVLDLSMRTRMMPGLLERYNEAVLRTRAGDAQGTAAAEMAAIVLSIEDAQSSITEAEKKLASGVFTQLSTQRQLTMLKSNQAAINDAISRFTVGSAVYKEVMTNSELPAGGDIRALSMPVTPETRVWPKRSLSAAVAGVAAAVLTIFFLIARNFMTRFLPEIR